MNNPACPLPRSLDTAFGALRGDTTAPAPLFAPDTHETRLPGDVLLHGDPEMRVDGHWSSPRGRTLEITARIEAPGRWLALHLPLSDPDLTGVTWLSLVTRITAARAATVRPCLRSGLEGGDTGSIPAQDGFRDDFFARDILATSQVVDVPQILTPAHIPNLPRTAPWRELVLFLPATTDFHLALHDLRLTAL